MSTVDEQVRAFYARQELAPDRAQAILESAKRRGQARRRRLYLAAAMLLVLLSSGLFLRSAMEDRALGDRVAAEVAMNHRKDLGAEISASSYAELGAALTKLTFPLEEPRRGMEGFELLGGRYCSIQAQLAAQLKVRDPAGRTATLYVTELTEELSSLPGTSRRQGEVAIKVWSEGGLLYALAETERAPQ